MKVAVICEFSGIVRDAFIQRGHDAISFDLLPTEKPGPHRQGDIMDLPLDYWKQFDLAICHPPCTYLTYAGNRSWNYPGRAEKRDEAVKFFMYLYNLPITHIAVENPLGYISKVFKKPDQIIQPYYFGERFSKRTCLWLKNVPPLFATGLEKKPEPLYICQGEKCKGKPINWCEGIRGQNEPRWKARSRTFQGIADAMADQWGIEL